jgi:ketosteroid isomerase-like protein
MTPEEIARAFSSHRFTEAEPYLADDVEWVNVGTEPLDGKDAVIEECTESAEYLEEVRTEFREFRTIVAENAVVVDSLAEYTEADGDVSTVRSCDIYDFANGLVTRITSYKVEV